MCHEGARHTGGVGGDAHLAQPHRAEQPALLADPAAQRGRRAERVDYLGHKYIW